MARDYRDYDGKVFTPTIVTEPRSFECRERPTNWWVKLNSDAAILDRVGTGLRWVAHDDRGCIIEAAVQRCIAIRPSDVAEVEAAGLALQHAVDTR